MNDFDEYKRIGEPEKVEKSEIWQTAIGLQQVDGLTPSEYLNRFFGNLLLGESNTLRNRDLRIPIASGTDVPANVPVKTENVPVNVPVKRKEEIIKMLLINRNLTADELAAVFSVTAKTIKRDFAVLKNEGKLKRVGSDKTGHWEIIQ